MVLGDNLLHNVAKDVEWIKQYMLTYEFKNSEQHKEILEAIKCLEEGKSKNTTAINYLRGGLSALFALFTGFALWVLTNIKG